MSLNAQRAINWIEQGYLPDNIVRKGIRRLLKERLLSIHADDAATASLEKNRFIAQMNQSPIALSPEKANQQHYEVPAEFYEWVLGKHNKYSCCYWRDETSTLEQAEIHAFEETCCHADLSNGQEILELGCGWGSLTLWLATHYPDSRITAVSNSHSQRIHIENRAHAAGLDNVAVITCDMNDFDIDQRFDRIVSVEMFEHMRNWRRLFKRVAGWLKDDGRFFMHVFSHRQSVYAFEVKNASDWMSEHFFSGGMMPSDDLALYFQNDLQIVNTWTWNGNHYAKTAEAWLRNMDANKDQVFLLIAKIYGEQQAQTWWMRWRLFFMACAESFAYAKGQQWHVRHYLFQKRHSDS
jgi:cyclopropane-fatty-acyl-phospholipid synthase